MEFNKITEDKNLLRNINDIDTTIDKFIDIQNKLVTCVKDIPNAVLDSKHNQDIDKLRIGFKDLRSSALSIVEPLMAANQKNDDRIAELETCYGELFSKWQNEKKKVEQAETRVLQLTAQNIQCSNFCTNVGAVLGNYLWKSSKFPHMINIWLNDNQTKMEEFLSIVNTTFASFIDTFQSDFPPLNNDECQFVMALMGTATNISSTPLGRQFLSNDKMGKILITRIVQSLSLIPTKSGDSMKRLMLMILYNISLNRVGLPLLLELKIEENIGSCLDNESITTDIQIAALRLLQSLTYALTNYNVLQRIIDSIPINRIELLATTMNNENEISKIAQEVVANIINCKTNADTCSQVSSSTDN